MWAPSNNPFPNPVGSKQWNNGLGFKYRFPIHNPALISHVISFSLSRIVPSKRHRLTVKQKKYGFIGATKKVIVLQLNRLVNTFEKEQWVDRFILWRSIRAALYRSKLPRKKIINVLSPVSRIIAIFCYCTMLIPFHLPPRDRFWPRWCGRH